jgi:hypothetical protein
MTVRRHVGDVPPPVQTYSTNRLRGSENDAAE